jgi:parallel beta-helix repeat protein
MGEQRTALILLLILFSLLFSVPEIRIVNAEPKTIVVPDDYPTITNAVGNATDGDTIFVKEGTYEIKENQKGTPLITGIEINKTLSIIGEDQTHTIIVFPPDTRMGMELLFSSKVGFLVHADDFVISNLTITNCDFGIQVTANGAQVSNILTSSIYLKGNYSRISGNNLTLASSYPPLTVKGFFNDIVHNIIFTIQCEGSFNSIIENSGEQGRIEVTDDSNFLAENCVIEISLSKANLNIIYNNSVSGISLKKCYNNTVSGNVVKGGRTVWGILMGNGSGNVFYGNNITDFYGVFSSPTKEGLYGYGVAIGGYECVAEKNLFYCNNFVNNYKHVSANWPVLGTGNYWDSGEEGNYWDDYSGVDSNGDGIGDVPYTVSGLEYVEDRHRHVGTVFGQDRYPLMAPFEIDKVTVELPEWASPPDVCLITPENTTYNTTNVSLNFTVNEETSWMGYSLDGQDNVTITETTLNLTELAEGSHTLTVYAIDTDGNTGASETISFTITKESEPEQQDQLNLILAGALTCLAIATGLGLLLYFKKCK